MPLKTLLRVAILAEILLAAVGLMAEIVLEPRLPEPLRNYLAAEGEKSWSTIHTVMLVLAVPMLIAAVVSWIGLWRLWRPARPIYLYLSIAGLLLTAFLGPSVASAVGSMFSDACTLTAGFILGLIYFSDLRHQFERRESL